MFTRCSPGCSLGCSLNRFFRILRRISKVYLERIFILFFSPNYRIATENRFFRELTEKGLQFRWRSPRRPKLRQCVYQARVVVGVLVLLRLKSYYWSLAVAALTEFGCWRGCSSSAVCICAGRIERNLVSRPRAASLLLYPVMCPTSLRFT